MTPKRAAARRELRKLKPIVKRERVALSPFWGRGRRRRTIERESALLQSVGGGEGSIKTDVDEGLDEGLS